MGKFVEFVRQRTYTVRFKVGLDKSLDAHTLGEEVWTSWGGEVAVCHGNKDGTILNDLYWNIHDVAQYLVAQGGVLVCCYPAAVKARQPFMPVLWPDHWGDVTAIHSSEDEMVVVDFPNSIQEIRDAEGEEGVDAVRDELFQPRRRSRDRRCQALKAPVHRGHRSGYKPPKR